MPSRKSASATASPRSCSAAGYALHFAGWKKHIGLYPVPRLEPALEAEIAPYRAEKDSVVFPHAQPVPYELIGRVADAIVAMRRDRAAG